MGQVRMSGRVGADPHSVRWAVTINTKGDAPIAHQQSGEDLGTDFVQFVTLPRNLPPTRRTDLKQDIWGGAQQDIEVLNKHLRIFDIVSNAPISLHLQ